MADAERGADMVMKANEAVMAAVRSVAEDAASMLQAVENSVQRIRSSGTRTPSSRAFASHCSAIFPTCWIACVPRRSGFGLLFRRPLRFSYLCGIDQGDRRRA